LSSVFRDDLAHSKNRKKKLPTGSQVFPGKAGVAMARDAGKAAEGIHRFDSAFAGDVGVPVRRCGKTN
jgi:hypothetical protein